MPLTGNTPDELRAWVLQPPAPLPELRLPGQADSEPPVGRGFAVAGRCVWQTPDTQGRVPWRERRLIVQSQAHARQQQTGLRERVEKAESALRARNTKPATQRTALQTRAQALLTRDAVTDSLRLSCTEQGPRQTGSGGRGRPGPTRATQTIETHTWTVEPTRQQEAINWFHRLAGWRGSVTNTPAGRVSLADAVTGYRQEGPPEHGVHRLTGGWLAMTPLFLQEDHRIRGWLGLLGIALRVLTLTEFVTRRNLAASGATRKGLYEGNPQRATGNPTTERVLKVFKDIPLYRHDTATATWYEVTALSPLQRRILQLLGIPDSVYAPPATPLIGSG